MNWGSQATSRVKGLASKKANLDRLLRSDTWKSGNITSLQRGTRFGSVGGFKMGSLASLRLPSMQDIVNMVAGSGKAGDVLSIVQSMNSLRSAFQGSKGIAGLLDKIPSDLANGVILSGLSVDGAVEQALQLQA